MHRTWEDIAAEEQDNKLINCTHLAHMLGEDEELVLPGSGSISVKITVTNLWGEKEEAIYINGKDLDLRTIPENACSLVRRKPLVDLLKLDQIGAPDLKHVLTSSRLFADVPVPPMEVLTHTALPAQYIAITQPDDLFAIACTPNGENLLQQIYGESVRVTPFAQDGLPLAKICLKAWKSAQQSELLGIFVLYQALITFGETPKEVYERTCHLVSLAKQFLKDQGVGEASLAEPALETRLLRNELASLRKAISDAAGFPLILSSIQDDVCLDFIRHKDLTSISSYELAMPFPSRSSKYQPMLGQEVEAYQKDYQDYFNRHASGHSTNMHDPAPRIIIDPEFGLYAAGRSVQEAELIARRSKHVFNIIQKASMLGGYRPIAPEAFFEVEYADPDQTEEDRSGKSSMYAGEIAVVTGAASGIGKACAASLLARGAVVVGLDISPSIEGLFPTKNFLGLVCDLADEKAVVQAVDRIVQAFGGLDMLVLNAGIFPAGCPIEKMEMADWYRVMRINLDSNLCLMREAYSLLKLSPRTGRVVLNGSRNVKAPGPSAVAYSSSKAAAVQMARVAALEWGKDGIRVNMVHPNQVFDTALYTEEILKARAAYYNITVEQYKKNNVLHVEITSHDVGELVAEMCGPLFAKITGVQVPIDGGNDRVI